MRLIILNQFFYPDHSATSQLMTDLAESLVERGLEVTALSGRGRYTGGERLARRDKYRGVRIERAWATSFGKRSTVGRLSDYLSFYLGASWKLLRLPRHDIVMALTTPPLIGLVALLIGRLRGMRVVALVQDVYPDIAVALGRLPARNPVTKLLDLLNRFLLRKSDRIVVLSDCMRERVAAKLNHEALSRIDVIHNWADGKKIKPRAREENPFADKHNLAGLFVILFSGNLGHVNEFSTVLEAARRLRERSDVVFLFIGEGAKSREIREFCERHKLENVRLLPYQLREILPYSLTAGHVSLVTLKDGLAGLSMPSKTYGIMAAGQAILFVGDRRSETARIVEQSGCGEVVAAGDSRRLADIISAWSSEEAKLAEFGRRARIFFEERFERRNAVDAYMETFTKCCGSASASHEGYRYAENK